MARSILWLLPLVLTACGGRSPWATWDGDGTAPPGQDAQVRPDAVVVLPEACEGPAWAAGPRELPRPVTVTSSRLVMDCCDGATAHFHASQFLGFDPIVMIRAWGLWPSPGTWDLGALGPTSDTGVEVRVHSLEDSTYQDQRLEGWLRLEGVDDPYSSPLSLSLCVTGVTGVTGIQGDSRVDGLRLWVPHLALMPWDWWERLALHLLQNPELTAEEAAARPLGELLLASVPLVTLGNLDFYEGSTHTLRMEPWYGDRLRGLLPEVGVHGLPFVVVVDAEPIYLGAFFTSLSSSSFGQPVIVLEDIAEGAVRIERAYPSPGAATGSDPRGDPRILELLEAVAKLAP